MGTSPAVTATVTKAARMTPGKVPRNDRVPSPPYGQIRECPLPLGSTGLSYEQSPTHRGGTCHHTKGTLGR